MIMRSIRYSRIRIRIRIDIHSFSDFSVKCDIHKKKQMLSNTA